MAVLVPSRRRGVELLDAPDVDSSLRTRSHRDIAVSNALFGGTRALLAELRIAVPALPQQASFVDVGTGTGEATAFAERFCVSLGVSLRTIGLDSDRGLARLSRRFAHHGVCGSALALPFADGSIDVVACSQLAHHFEEGDLRTLIREMHRVARRRVIISDLRRSWLAVAGLWSSSFPLRFHPVSRHDGVVSILRGFTLAELRALVYETVRVRPTVRRRWAFRLTASWDPGSSTTPQTSRSAR